MERENTRLNPFNEHEKMKLRREKKKLYMRYWRANNQEKYREMSRISAKKWRLKNPEKANAISKKWRENNQEIYKESKRVSEKKRRESNPELFLATAREYQKKYRRANPEKCKERNRKTAKNRREKFPEKVREETVRWRNQNSERYRELSLKHHLKKYGLTMSAFSRMVANQKGKCLICGAIPDKSSKINSRLMVDHDHKTGEIRGLLCHRCNSGISLFNECPKILLEAIRYLKKQTN